MRSREEPVEVTVFSLTILSIPPVANYPSLISAPSKSSSCSDKIMVICLYGKITKGPDCSAFSMLRNAGILSEEGVDRSHSGDGSPGMGSALKIFLQFLAVHRAQFFDFFLRALSVEIPVHAYICL